MENHKILIGDSFSLEFSYTQDQVIAFAKSTGDDNPIHLDEEFASKTVFKMPIIHGFLGAAVFSKIFGTLFPGSGTIYLKQGLSFMKPMFTNELYKATVEVIDVNTEKHRATISTKVQNQKLEDVILGEALISNIEKI